MMIIMKTLCKLIEVRLMFMSSCQARQLVGSSGVVLNFVFHSSGDKAFQLCTIVYLFWHASKISVPMWYLFYKIRLFPNLWRAFLVTCNLCLQRCAWLTKVTRNECWMLMLHLDCFTHSPLMMLEMLHWRTIFRIIYT